MVAMVRHEEFIEAVYRHTLRRVSRVCVPFLVSLCVWRRLGFVFALGGGRFPRQTQLWSSFLYVRVLATTVAVWQAPLVKHGLWVGENLRLFLSSRPRICRGAIFARLIKGQPLWHASS